MQTPAAAPGGAGHSQTFLSMKAAKQCSDQQLRGHGGTSPNCGNPADPADPARLCSPSPTRGNCRCPWHENPGVWASSASRPESLPPLWADFSKNSFKFYFTHIKAWDLEHGTPRVWQISGIWRVTNLHKLVVKKPQFCSLFSQTEGSTSWVYSTLLGSCLLVGMALMSAT